VASVALDPGPRRGLCFWKNATDVSSCAGRGEWRIVQAMSELTRWHRTARVSLARPLMVHGEDEPEVLRRMADELDWLAEAERRGPVTAALKNNTQKPSQCRIRQRPVSEPKRQDSH
jgi:hypothetical protein